MRTPTLNTGFSLSDFNTVLANLGSKGAGTGACCFEAITLRLTATPFAGYDLFYATSQFSFTAPACDGAGLTTYVANDVGVSGLLLRCTSGQSAPGDPTVQIEVDEQQVTFTPNLNPAVPSTIAGVPFLQAVAQGALDGAVIQRDRWVFGRTGGPPVGGVKMFYGFTASIDKLGRTEAVLKVKSDLVLLNTLMPRNVYQPNCQWTIYDTNCGVTQSSYASHASVGASPTAAFIPWTGATAQFTGGVIELESGPNTNVTRTIKAGVARARLVVANPQPHLPAAGDNFVAYPGCDRTLAGGCAFFGNQARYRGFNFVPPPELAV